MKERPPQKNSGVKQGQVVFEELSKIKGELTELKQEMKENFEKLRVQQEKTDESITRIGALLEKCKESSFG